MLVDRETRVAFVSGEPGIGKTRLALEAARAVGEGVPVLAGRCDDDAPPFQPFADALRHLVRTVSATTLRSHLGSRSQELVRLSPQLADVLGEDARPARADPDSERHLLFEAVHLWMSACASPDGAVFVVDDLHWADAGSLQLLRRLLRDGEGTPLLILATYRDTDVDRRHPLSGLLRDLGHESRVERISLRGLGVEAVDDLVRSVTGRSRAGDGSRIWQQTDGNPFFVLEVARSLDPDHDDVPLPEGVRAAVGQRLDRLDDRINDLLSIASVAGSEFGVRLVSEVAGASEDDVLDAFEAASRAGLVVEVGPSRFRFVHALVRSTIYEELGSTRRVRRHRQVAEAMERRPGADLVTLANQWLAAGDSHDVVPKALSAAVDGGADALRRLAFDQAAALFERGLQLLDETGWGDRRVRARLLIGVGQSHGNAGRPYRQFMTEAADIAERLGDSHLLAECALFTPREFAEATVQLDEERVELLTRALVAIGSESSAQNALLRSGIAFELALVDPDRAATFAENAISTAREVADIETLVRVLFNCWIALGSPDLAGRRASITEEMLELTEHLADPVLRYRAVSLRQWVTFESGDGDESRVITEERLRLVAMVPLPSAQWTAAYDRAALVLADGDPVAAESIANRALALGEALEQPDAALFHGAALLGIRRTQGRLGELIPDIEAVIEAIPPIASLYRGVLALANAQAGNVDKARTIVEAADLHLIPRSVTWLSAITCYAEAGALSGAVSRASELHDLLQPYQGLNVYSGATIDGPVLRYLALCSRTLGQARRANEEFAAALTVAERFRHRYYAATTKLEWGQLLLDADPPRAKTLLQEAAHESAVIQAAHVRRAALTALGSRRWDPPT